MIKTNCVDILLKKLFYNLGLTVARNPGYFVIVPVFLSLICMTGFQKLHYEMDSEYLFSPEDGPGKAERTIVESFFKTNYSSRFNPSRITRQGRYAKIIAIPRVGDDMLNVATWKELRSLDDAIKNIAIAFGEPQELFTYREICARWMGECFENDVLNLDQIMDQIEKKELNLTFPVMLNPVTWDAHAFPAFSGKTLVSRDDIIEKIRSVQLMYFLTADTKSQDERGALWEEAFLTTIENLEKNNTFQFISTARYASRTLDVELEKNTRDVIPYFTITFATMVVFSIFTCMMTDWVRSKPILGLLGNISAAMGTLAAFGLAVYMGYDFIGIVLAAPFLTCSIGIDDTFVMLAAWRRTPVTMNVPERVANMLSEAAVSITITSLTDIVSLWIGKTSPFPAIQLFCIYTGLAVTFILVWHVTFFTACVAICGYLEQKNAHCITCIPVLPVSLAHEKSWFYRVFCTGGINLKDPDNPEDNPENSITVWCRDNLGNGLNKWPVKILVIILFLAYMAGAIYGLTIIQEGLQRSKLSRPDSYSIAFYEREDFYFREYSYRIQMVIHGDLDYGNVTVRNQIENLTRTFESSPFVSSSSMYTESWLRTFLSYIDRNSNIINGTADVPMTSFISALKESWLFPTNPFSLDVKFNEDESKIIASRFIIQTVNISDTNTEKDMVNDLRRIAQQSSLNVTVYHPYFLFFDQFELVRPTTIQSTVYGGIIMMIITFVFIPNFSSSIWVAFTIVSVEFGVIGYMALWNVNLDSISMVNLIMCVGFSVDFTAHICYAYMSSDKNNCKEKTKESLYSLGLPIIQGALSTILGVGALLFVGSYIFLVFFKVIFLVTFFGAMHGILLLPVLLSLFERKKSTKVDKKCTPPYCIPHATLPPPPPPPMSHLHNPKHFGIPLHGMVQGSSMVFYGVDKKYYGHEKDLGIGTSAEDSSETSSFESQNKNDNIHQKYVDGWKKSSPSGRPYSRQDYIDEQHWNNISMEFLSRTRVNHNAANLQHRNFYKDKD